MVQLSVLVVLAFILVKLIKQANNRNLMPERRRILNKAFYLNYKPSSFFCTNFYFFIFLKKFLVLFLIVFFNKQTDYVVALIIAIFLVWILIIITHQVFE